MSMSPKQLIIYGVTTVVLVNTSIFGTLYIIDWLNGPSAEELRALKEAEEKAALEAVYAKLPPLPEFKSKAQYLLTIGEAIAICENKLNETVKTGKSWEVNMIESRYVPATEIYKIFLKYATLATREQESKSFKVTCEVSGEKKVVDIWKAEPV